MRKPNNTGKENFFKKKEGDKSKIPSGRRPKPRSSGDRPARSFDRAGERPFGKKNTAEGSSSGRDTASSGRRPKPRPADDKPRRSSDRGDNEGSFSKKTVRKEGAPARERSPSDRKYKPRPSGDKPHRSPERTAERGSYKKEQGREKQAGADKPQGEYSKDRYSRKSQGRGFDSNARKYGSDRKLGGVAERKFSKPVEEETGAVKRVKFDDFEEGKVFSNTLKKKPFKEKRTFKKQAPGKIQTGEGLVRLNKYLANAGVASRREADTLIQSGVVKVNGVVVDQLGYKISPGDKVTYGDAPVKSERKVYLLLNKPKDYISTVDDPQERKTVMELISKACKERVYPVGRLDRNTTGLLLFTNDGELTTKLTHPKFGVKKVYHVSLNKGLKPEDFKAITEGVELEDGVIKADDLAFVGEGKKEIGIEIHSGRNRIVRRIFEHLGYDVLKLDRVVFAGLTKKDLPRGKHRFLTAKEIGFLQMVG